MTRANMMIIRGKDGKEIIDESWSRLQHRACRSMAPKHVIGGTSFYDLVLLVPGRAPVRCEAMLSFRSNCLSVPADVVDLIPPEFWDPLEAVKYALDNGLCTPPVMPREW